MALTHPKHSILDLLDAQAHIWNHIFNFINSMSLKCMIQLGIPDTIHNHGKPMTLSELTKALNIDEAKSSCIERLMRVMIHSKFFIKARVDGKEGYWLTPSSLLLLKDEPLSLTPFIIAVLDPILIDPWHRWSEWFGMNDSTLFDAIHGTTFWENAGHDARLNSLFNAAMASDTNLVSRIIIEDCRHIFQGLKTMVDVAGGTGTMAKAIVDAFPGLKGIVLDLPHVVAGLKEDDNLKYVGGDMFESIPPADAVFLKWILHDWPDEECVKILRKCKEAIPSKEKGGKVIVIDMVIKDNETDDKYNETQLFFDMLMMVLHGGRERTDDEWKNIFIEAGFTNYKVTKVLGLRSVIEVYP